MRDPMRLQLLYQAWSEFDSKRYDAATATLDRRQSEVASTPLDWMLRARIAESQGRLAEALDKLKRIPDSAVIGARARLKAGSDRADEGSRLCRRGGLSAARSRSIRP